MPTPKLLTLVCLLLASIVGLFILANKLALFTQRQTEHELSALTDDGQLQRKDAVFSILAIALIMTVTLGLIAGLFMTSRLAGKLLIVLPAFIGCFSLLRYIFHDRYKPALAICAISLTVLWLIFPNWVTLNLAALCIVLDMLVRFRNAKFLNLAILGAGIVLYDVVAVFVTKHMVLLANLVIEGNLPILIRVPDGLSFNAGLVFAVGLGDVVLPGFVVMLAMREARRLNQTSLGHWTIGGYVVSFVVMGLLMWLFKIPGMPATLFLIPGVFGGLALGAIRGGIWPAIASSQSVESAVN